MMTRDEMRAECAEAFMVCMGWEDSPGKRQAALSLLDALNGIAWVIPVAATQGERPLRQGNIQNNDLTNPPEKKPK